MFIADDYDYYGDNDDDDNGNIVETCKFMYLKLIILYFITFFYTF